MYETSNINGWYDDIKSWLDEWFGRHVSSRDLNI